MRTVFRGLLIGLATLAVALAAGYLALQRADIAWTRLEAKYANAQSKYLDLPGALHVHYRDQGRRDGPVLIMVHGFSASLHAWEPWVARLGSDYRIITLDLPGHGLTRAPEGYVAGIDGYADLVDDLAQRLGAGPYVVAGNSMGGAVAWDDALGHGDRVKGLVLVDAAGWPGAPASAGPPQLIFAILHNPIGRALIRHIDTSGMAESGLKAAYVDASLVTPALVNRYVELSRAPGHRDILLTIQTRSGEPVTEARLRSIRVPTLVMHGEQDALIPLEDGKGFAGAIPGARLITYPGVGHVPMEQIPDKSAADLRRFLTGLDASKPAA